MERKLILCVLAAFVSFSCSRIPVTGYGDGFRVDVRVTRSDIFAATVEADGQEQEGGQDSSHQFAYWVMITRKDMSPGASSVYRSEVVTKMLTVPTVHS